MRLDNPARPDRVIPALSPVPDTDHLSDRLAGLVDDSRSEGTRRAYAADWRRWEAWCHQHGVQALPARPVDVAEYVAQYGASVEAGRTRPHAAATLQRWVAAIDALHRTHRLPPPGADELVRNALSGARRRQARARQTVLPGQAQPLSLADLRLMLTAIQTTTWPKGVLAARDTAMLLAGFAGGRRRSELVGARIGDLSWHAHDGYHWRIPVSKTDQDGDGHVVVLPRGQHVLTCAPCALTRWLHLRAALAAAAATPPGHDDTQLTDRTRWRAAGRRQRIAAMSFLHRTPTTPEEHVCHRPPNWPTAQTAPPLNIPLVYLAVRPTDRLFVADTAPAAPAARCPGKPSPTPSSGPAAPRTWPQPGTPPTRSGPGSSPKPTAPAQPCWRSSNKPDTAPTNPSPSTDADTHPPTATPSPASASNPLDRRA